MQTFRCFVSRLMHVVLQLMFEAGVDIGFALWLRPALLLARILFHLLLPSLLDCLSTLVILAFCMQPQLPQL